MEAILNTESKFSALVKLRRGGREGKGGKQEQKGGAPVLMMGCGGQCETVRSQGCPSYSTTSKCFSSFCPYSELSVFDVTVIAMSVLWSFPFVVMCCNSSLDS